MLVSIMLITWCSQLLPVAGQTCTWSTSRTSRLTLQQGVTSVRAAKLYTTPLTSQLVCTSQCISNAACYYVTVDKTSQLCSLYTQAASYINITGSLYAIVLADVQVSQTGSHILHSAKAGD
jgi:hypothetical protein